MSKQPKIEIKKLNPKDIMKYEMFFILWTVVYGIAIGYWFAKSGLFWYLVLVPLPIFIKLHFQSGTKPTIIIYNDKHRKK